MSEAIGATTTIRIDPKLRYMLELAARKRRQTTSEVLRWAVETYLMKFALDDKTPLSVMQHKLWADNPDKRFQKLAQRLPELLTFQEYARWKEMRERGDGCAMSGDPDFLSSKR